MTKRIDAAMNRVKYSALHSPLHGATTEPKRKKLAPGNDPVLSLCHGRHCAIESARAQFSPPSRENRALVEIVTGIRAGTLAWHGADAAPRGGANGAQNEKRGSNPPVPSLALIP